MSEEQKPKNARLLSIDALRGFDMFWIAGGTVIFSSLHKIVDSGFTEELAQQLKHAKWEGFNFLDIIMPLFMFISGCSLVFSFQKRLEKDGTKKVYSHIFRRVIILWVLGMVYQGHLLTLDSSKINIFSNTLQAIAIGYLGSSLILLIKNLKWQIAISSLLLFTYWLIMNFIPGYDLTLENNLASYIDDQVLGEFRGSRQYTWVLSSLAFTCTVMLGVFSGSILKNKDTDKKQKLKSLIIFGSSLLIAGHLLTLHEPCIKKIWTSSFTLISGGYCVLLLSLFYWIIDIREIKWWCPPFIYLGSNAIFVYMVFAYDRFFSSKGLVDKIVFGTKPYLGSWYPFILSILGMCFTIFFFRYLHKKQTFIKV